MRRFLPLALLLVSILTASARNAFAIDVMATDKLADRYRDTVFGESIKVQWYADGKALWYRLQVGPARHRFRAARVDGTEVDDLFDHAALAAALSEHSKTDVEPDRLPFESLELNADGTRFMFTAFDTRWQASTLAVDAFTIEPLPATPSEAVEAAPAPQQQRDSSSQSPDERWEVVVRDYNVFLRAADERNTGKQLTFDGTPHDAYSGRVHWSPDSSRFVVLQTKDGFDRKVTVVESTPDDQLQPRVRTYDYRKAGDDIPQARPRLFNANSAQRIELDETLWTNPWSLGSVRWRANSAAFTVAYNERGHRLLRVIEVDAENGSARSVVEEARDTHIAYADKYLCQWFGDDQLVWMSERDGWNHLYLYDVETGEPIRQLTSGQWAVKRIIGTNESQELLWLETYGRPGCSDSLYTHYAKVNLDGELVWLSEADGTHEAPQFSPDWSHYAVTWSRVDQPPVHELRRSSDGSLVMKLDEADASALYETGWKPPIRFAAKGRDAEVDVHGVLFTPTDLDPAKKYPVIEDCYMGLPIVPKSFRAWDGRRALAELGFVVVVNDPMVTVWPSRRHWDTGYQNLGDGGFPDRIAWIKAAAAAHPFMDLSRVGIYGTSAGGQASLRAMLAYGDFYKAAVSSCGCHDNRMDKIWWNEYWMGWPVGPHYAEQSNVTNAAKLQGPLLLIVGEVDTNVDPASTMQVVDALIDADKDFDLIVLPGAGHTSGGRYGERKRREFFVDHLLSDH